jgi:hypothetical protein
LTRTRYGDALLRHRNPVAHFGWCVRRGGQLGVDASGCPNCVAHFERIKARPSVQKLLAWEKSVNEEFAKAA